MLCLISLYPCLLLNTPLPFPFPLPSISPRPALRKLPSPPNTPPGLPFSLPLRLHDKVHDVCMCCVWQMWAIIKNNDLNSMKGLIDAAPTVVHARSSDGRGPLWWAYEFKREGMKQLLVKRGCDPEAKDRSGIRARDLDSGKKQLGGTPKAEKAGGDGEKWKREGQGRIKEEAGDREI